MSPLQSVLPCTWCFHLLTGGICLAYVPKAQHVKSFLPQMQSTMILSSTSCTSAQAQAAFS